LVDHRRAQAKINAPRSISVVEAKLRDTTACVERAELSITKRCWGGGRGKEGTGVGGSNEAGGVKSGWVGAEEAATMSQKAGWETRACDGSAQWTLGVAASASGARGKLLLVTGVVGSPGDGERLQTPGLPAPRRGCPQVCLPTLFWTNWHAPALIGRPHSVSPRLPTGGPFPIREEAAFTEYLHSRLTPFVREPYRP
jgi:hypothetical protein